MLSWTKYRFEYKPCTRCATATQTTEHTRMHSVSCTTNNRINNKVDRVLFTQWINSYANYQIIIDQILLNSFYFYIFTPGGNAQRNENLRPEKTCLAEKKCHHHHRLVVTDMRPPLPFKIFKYVFHKIASNLLFDLLPGIINLCFVFSYRLVILLFVHFARSFSQTLASE